MTAATSRIIQRALASTGPWTTITTVTPTATTYKDTSVTNGTEYFYRVIGVNAVGNSAPSNVASATPQAAGSEYMLLQTASEMYYAEADFASGSFSVLAKVSLTNDSTGDVFTFDPVNQHIISPTSTRGVTVYEYDGTSTLSTIETISSTFQNSPDSLFWDTSNEPKIYGFAEGPGGNGLSIFDYDPANTPSFARDTVYSFPNWTADDLGLLLDFRKNNSTSELGDLIVGVGRTTSQIWRSFTVSGTTVTDLGSLSGASFAATTYNDVAWDRDTGTMAFDTGRIISIDTSSGAFTDHGTATLTFDQISTKYSMCMGQEDLVVFIGTDGANLWLESFDVSTRTTWTHLDSLQLSVSPSPASIWASPYTPGNLLCTNGSSGDDWVVATVAPDGTLTEVGATLNTETGISNAGNYSACWWLTGPLTAPA
jgi:hypothetical protein